MFWALRWFCGLLAGSFSLQHLEYPKYVNVADDVGENLAPFLQTCLVRDHTSCSQYSGK